jgi:ribosomal protein S18 acetylase RimI-like enzyme
MKSPTILTQATEDDLGTAVSKNLYALFRSMQVLPGCELVEGERLSYHHAFPENPMFKGVWGTRLADDEVESEIDKAVKWFEQRNVPNFFWWTDSQTQPPDLPERLLKRGFDGNLEGDPGMALDLHALDDKADELQGFSVVRASEPNTLLDWRDVFVAAFEMSVSGGQAWVDATPAAGGTNAPWKMYVGYLDNKPVATSMLFNGAGVAGIYAIGTLPEMRRKGFGSAITLMPLLDARQQGYRYAVLFATRSGHPVYERLGFREVPCKIGVYMFEKA